MAESIMAESIAWKHADDQAPPHTPGMWSKEVICLTSHGNIFKLSFCGDWQRLALFLPGERVEWWIESPQLLKI